MRHDQVVTHILVRKEADMLDAKWLKDVLLEVCIKTKTTGALDSNASPINVDLYASVV